MSKKKYCLWLLCVCFISLSCRTDNSGAPSPVLNEDPRMLADELLGKIFATYQGYTRDSFQNRVSTDFYPVRSEFLNTAESGFYSGKVLGINYFIDNVFKKDNMLAVGFKWEKKVAPYASGQSNIVKGSSEFNFRNVNGEWVLEKISGNNPFS